MDDRDYLDERPRSRQPPRGAALARPSRGLPRGAHLWREDSNHVRRPGYEYSPPSGRGSASRRGRGGPYRDEYATRGARSSPGFPRGRGYPGRHVPREDPFLRRPDRGYAYERDTDGAYGSGAPSNYVEAGPGMKRSYGDNEAAPFYEASHRGYPRARVDYEDRAPVGGAHYTEPTRAPLGRSSVRSAVPQPAGSGSLSQAPMPVYDQPVLSSMYGSGGHGYSSMIPGDNDYGSGAGELRGGSYNSSVYGGRPSSTYGLPGSGSGSYY